MGRKKKPENNYFHEGVEQAVLQYNIAETQLERDKLFRIVYPALAKIAQVYYNKIKPTYIKGEPLDIQLDCVSYLTERMDKIKDGKGKAFSYFTVCAKNYYIQQNMFAYTKVGKVLNTSELPENYDMEDIQTSRLEEMEDAAKLLDAFANYLYENVDNISGKLSRKIKPIILEVVKLMRNVDMNSEFNRRAIMNSLVELNGMHVDRHHITKVFNMIEIHYIKFKTHWDNYKEPMPFLTKRSLNKNEIDYCIKNYKLADRKYGIIALSKHFGVDAYIVKRELSKAGLAAS